MSVTAQCGTCGKRFRVDDKFAGRKVRCKDCGGVIAVPALAGEAPLPSAARSAKPASTTRSAPTSPPAPRRPAAVAPPPPPPPPDDPFGSIDALMSLEATGEVQDAPPLPAPRGRFGRKAAAAAPSSPVEPPPLAPALGSLAPPPRRGTRYRGDPTPPYAARPPRDAYVSIPGEDTIDGLLPMASIGVLIVCMVITFIRVMSTINEMTRGNPPPGTYARAIGYLTGTAIGLLIGFFGILAPLCMLGVFIASKIMRFAKAGSFYFRCATVVCAPTSLVIVVNGFGFAEPTGLTWTVTLPVFFGVLWLMFRLKPLEYLVTAVSVSVTMLAIPLFLLTLLLSAVGIQGGIFAFAKARDRAVVVKSSANLKQVYMALAIYANEHKGQYPRTLDELTATGGAGLTRDEIRSPIDGQAYGYNYFPGMNNAMPGDYAIAYEQTFSTAGTSKEPSRPVLFGDGSVQQVTESQWPRVMARNAEFQRSRTGGDGSGAGNGGASLPARDVAVESSAVRSMFQRIDGALRQYAAAHGGRYPFSLSELIQAGALTELDLRIPNSNARIIYEAGPLRTPLPANVIVLQDPIMRPDGRLILFGDGRIVPVPLDRWAQVVRASTDAKRMAARPR
jgi:hypothetical protein